MTTRKVQESKLQRLMPSLFPRHLFASNCTPNENRITEERKQAKWAMGIMNDPHCSEVPGSVRLVSSQKTVPSSPQDTVKTTASSIPPVITSEPRNSTGDKKLTKDGAIILEPQPDDSQNDPLNWPSWRRDTALMSLGFFCMLGGGMTPILAAGFTNVAETYTVATTKVPLTTGLYMLGLGFGSVIASPTAILFGKRPVYLTGAIMFVCTTVWCALSPSFVSLLVARVFQGFTLSPTECLPSATITEIFFLHERAYRIGIYTMLVLGGKNLVPLISAAIIQSLGWRWVFGIVAMVGGLCCVLLFLFMPETFWDRSSRLEGMSPPQHGCNVSLREKEVHIHVPEPTGSEANQAEKNNDATLVGLVTSNKSATIRNMSLAHHPNHGCHDGLMLEAQINEEISGKFENIDPAHSALGTRVPTTPAAPMSSSEAELSVSSSLISFHSFSASPVIHRDGDQIERAISAPATPRLYNSPLPCVDDVEKIRMSMGPDTHTLQRYTSRLRVAPRQTFIQQLKFYNGRLNNDNWFRVAIRPFILYSYPAVLWSSLVYACSIGWLIILSESVVVIYRTRDTYNFSALSAGLVYISPFIGGILGTVIAGKFGDIIARAMSKRNNGLYEPEFRLVMAIPVTVSTTIGLMGFGWSAQIHDAWIVPSLFFGIISFGCSLGSTTAIAFCVDSYRQYAGEALVTLNFTKNVVHGMGFSFFFTSWLEKDGSKMVFIWLGVIQLILMGFTVPVYIFGKRARMRTVRLDLMEKF